MYSNRLEKLDFKTALKIGLTLCFNDIHFFSDYLDINKIKDNRFSCFESVVFMVSKNLSRIENDSLRSEYDMCAEELENFCEEDNIFYDECVNVCTEILNLLEFIDTRDKKYILQIMRSFFENKEAYLQKKYENSDDIINKYINNMMQIDLQWFVG